MNEEQIRAEFEKFMSDKGYSLNYAGDGQYTYNSTQLNWEVWQAAFKAGQASLSAKSVPEADEATTELRVVYEAARKFLRYNGVDKDKVNQAVDELDEAIEAVKHIDGGYKDFPLEAVPPLPTDDDRVRELEKDADRYRWLCENKFVRWPDIVGFNFDADTGIDEAIDQAMKRARK